MKRKPRAGDVWSPGPDSVSVDGARGERWKPSQEGSLTSFSNLGRVGSSTGEPTYGWLLRVLGAGSIER